MSEREIADVLADALAPSLYEALMEVTADSWRQWRFLTPEARETHRVRAAEMVAEGLAPAFRAIVGNAWHDGWIAGLQRHAVRRRRRKAMDAQSAQRRPGDAMTTPRDRIADALAWMGPDGAWATDCVMAVLDDEMGRTA